jgi:hypothetical protein
VTITNKVSLKSVNGGNTPVADVVDAPTIGTATAGVGTASVTFTAAATGGAATSYGAISTPGSITGTSATSPITVSGLTSGTAYTFKAYGINAGGTWNTVLSAASNSVTPIETSFESIATVNAAGGESVLEITSIPQTYKHLQVRGMMKLSSATTAVTNHYFRYNGSTSTSRHYSDFSSGGASFNTVISSTSNSDSYSLLLNGATQANGSVLGVFIIDIYNYTNAYFKTYSAFSGVAQSTDATSAVAFQVGMLRDTAAITSLTFPNLAGGTIGALSTISLYGIKG